MAKDETPPFISVENSEGISVTNSVSIGRPLIEAKNSRNVSVDNTTMISPAEGERERGTPQEPWYKRFWWAIVIALIGVPFTIFAEVIKGWLRIGK